MNAREAAIAHQMEERLRGDYLVREIQRSGDDLRGAFYSGDFVFSEQLEGDTVFFLMVDEGKAVRYQPEYQNRHDSSEEEPALIALNDLFQQYLFPTTLLPTGISQQMPGCLYTSTEAYYSAPLTTPEPPPDSLS